MSTAGTPREVFCIGIVTIVIPAARIKWLLPRLGANAGTEAKVVQIVLPGKVARKPRAGILGAPSGYSGGPRLVGVLGYPESMLDAGACTLVSAHLVVVLCNCCEMQYAESRCICFVPLKPGNVSITPPHRTQAG